MADIQTLKAELESQIEEAKRLNEQVRAQLAQASGGLSEAALTRIVEAAAAPANTLAKKLKPENAEARKLGPFEHPEGGEKFPKPHVFNANGGGEVAIWYGCSDRTDTRGILRIHHNEITYWEAQALVQLYGSLGKGERRTCRDGKWRVVVSDMGDRMDLLVPIKSADDRHDLPSFLEVIQELQTGHRTANAMELAERVALLEQQLAAQTATA